MRMGSVSLNMRQSSTNTFRTARSKWDNCELVVFCSLVRLGYSSMTNSISSAIMRVNSLADSMRRFNYLRTTLLILLSEALAHRLLPRVVKVAAW